MTPLNSRAPTGSPSIQNILVNRRAHEEQLAMLATQACQNDASKTARAVAARAGYSPATMTAYVAEMAAGCPGRVLDTTASEPGAVVWLALKEGSGSGPDSPASLDRVATALRRPAAEVAALAPADRALAVEQAAFAQAVAALADWQRARRALYVAGGGEDAFRFVLDDDQLLDLWACVDLAQLREALPGLRVVDQRAENPLNPGGSTPPSDGVIADAAGLDALAGEQAVDSASGVLLQGASPRRSNSIDSDVSMTDASPIEKSDTEPDTSTAEVKSGRNSFSDVSMPDAPPLSSSHSPSDVSMTDASPVGARNESPPEEAMSMTELLFGVQAGDIPWERAMIDKFAGLKISDDSSDWCTTNSFSSDEQATDASPDLLTAEVLQELFCAGSVVIESSSDDNHE